MKMFRDGSVYISPEVRFYVALRRRQIIGTVEGSGMTEDQVVDNDLRQKYTEENPDWMEAWDKHCSARQRAKKEYDQIEAEAIGLSPELEVNNGLK